MSYAIKQNLLRLYPLVVAIILFSAASLKLLEYGTSSSLGVSIVNRPAFMLASSCFELFLAIWLVIGIFPGVLRWVGVAFFTSAALITTYEGTHGYSSCGCFGPVPTSPKIIFCLDVLIVACFTVGKLRATPHNSKVLSGIAIGFAVLVMLSAIVFHQRLAEDPLLAQPDSSVFLRPDTWVGKRFPLISFTDIGPELEAGAWQVILVHSDCPVCQEVLSKVEQDARSAIIEIPSDTVSSRSLFVNGGVKCRVGSLDPKIKWYVTTPVILHLQSGMVSDERVGQDAEAFNEKRGRG